jgi:hypothetical protein
MRTMRPFDADQRKQWDPKTAHLAARFGETI